MKFIMEPEKWENDTSHIEYISFPLPSLLSLPVLEKPCGINIVWGNDSGNECHRRRYLGQLERK